jgi:hypothetical protein
MGWETRRGKRYYYRKVRVNGPVRSIYFGSGVTAWLAAQEDAQKQAAIQRHREEQKRLSLFSDYKKSRAYKETLALLMKESQM